MKNQRKEPDFCTKCGNHIRGNAPPLDVCKKDGRLCMVKREHAQGKNAALKCKDYFDKPEN